MPYSDQVMRLIIYDPWRTSWNETLQAHNKQNRKKCPNKKQNTYEPCHTEWKLHFIYSLFNQFSPANAGGCCGGVLPARSCRSDFTAQDTFGAPMWSHAHWAELIGCSIRYEIGESITTRCTRSHCQPIQTCGRRNQTPARPTNGGYCQPMQAHESERARARDWRKRSN